MHYEDAEEMAKELYANYIDELEIRYQHEVETTQPYWDDSPKTVIYEKINQAEITDVTCMNLAFGPFLL